MRADGIIKENVHSDAVDDPGSLDEIDNWKPRWARVIRGKAEVIRLSLVCLLAKGHLLIEDVPGVGKTTLAHALARSVDCILSPACNSLAHAFAERRFWALTVYNAHTEHSSFKQGRFSPISSGRRKLIERLREQSAFVGGDERDAGDGGRPLVCALRNRFCCGKQNPAEHHGTYPLPESQLDDRF